MPATPDLMPRGLAQKLLPWALAAAWLLCASAAQALSTGPTGRLNDTGQTQCDNGSNVMVTCSTANTGDASAMPRQDGRFGRDRASPTKVGGGAAGFDFTRICWAGAVEGTTVDVGKGTCTGKLENNYTDTARAKPATDWACTKDNVTNLIWSMEIGYGDWPIYATTTLPAATNTANRCGFSTDWRLPNRRELLSIVNRDGRQPSIDLDYFPATRSDYVWSSDPYMDDLRYVWTVLFREGQTLNVLNSKYAFVLLVRSGE